MFCTLTLIWNSPYFSFFCHSVWNAQLSSAHALIRNFFLVLLLFQSSIAIPIPGLQYCIAIQNSKTCSSLAKWKWCGVYIKKQTELPDINILVKITLESFIIFCEGFHQQRKSPLQLFCSKTLRFLKYLFCLAKNSKFKLPFWVPQLG